MPTKAFYWQLYISAYTAALGIPLLFSPKAAIAYLGFDPVMVDQGPFVHLTGMFLLGLTLVTFRIWQKKMADMVLGTVFLRVFIIITLLIVGVRGDFPFLFVMAAIVGIGVAGTLWSLRGQDLKQYL